jgi:hypothetical protein
MVVGLLLLSVSSFAGTGDINTNNPNIDGKHHKKGLPITIWIQFPGVFPYGSGPSGALPVTTMILPTDTDQTKAEKIAASVNKGFNTSCASAVRTAGGQWHVQLSYNKNGTNIAGASIIKPGDDQTGEGATVVAMNLPQKGLTLTAYLGFDTGISGQDRFGNPSTFTWSVGYAGFTDTATLSYNQVTTPTLDGLVSQMYGDLRAGMPAWMQGNFHLDLQDDYAYFNFPQGQTDYFSASISNDSLVEPNGGLAYTPEPSSLFLLGSGVLGLSGFLRNRLFTRS